MISAFGIDHSLIAKSTDDARRERYYGRQSAALGTLGAATGAMGIGAGIIGHQERQGKDPMGFAEPHHAREKVSPNKFASRMAPHIEGHGAQLKYAGVGTAAALGLAGAYKYKQRNLRHKRQLAALQAKAGPKQLTKADRSRGDRASDLALAGGTAALGGATLTEGMRQRHYLNRDANKQIHQARQAHLLLAGNKGAVKRGEPRWGTPKELEFARRQRKIGLRVAGVKKPAALLTTGASALGGALAIEAGRHTFSRKSQS